MYQSNICYEFKKFQFIQDGTNCKFTLLLNDKEVFSRKPCASPMSHSSYEGEYSIKMSGETTSGYPRVLNGQIKNFKFYNNIQHRYFFPEKPS